MSARKFVVLVLVVFAKAQDGYTVNDDINTSTAVDNTQVSRSPAPRHSVTRFKIQDSTIGFLQAKLNNSSWCTDKYEKVNKLQTTQYSRCWKIMMSTLLFADHWRTSFLRTQFRRRFSLVWSPKLRLLDWQRRGGGQRKASWWVGEEDLVTWEW